MATLTLSNVGKSYDGAAKAVSNVDLDIADGEFIVLVGPSGCGKSTLLRMVAGLESITEGEVRIGDQVVNDLDPAERDIAMVFQNYALYPHMSVQQNLEYGLKNRGTPKPEIAARVAEAARILELTPYLDRRPRQLSGGQRQRVAMGRAIVRQPKAFLFDEPLSNLDAKLRVQMRAEIKQLQRRLGTTSLYVTHDQLEAMTLADRLVVLNGGKIEQLGTPLEVYRRPASTFVAAFIGSPAMNLVPAVVDGGKMRVGEGSLPLAAAVDASEITIGLRAEDLRMTQDEGLRFDVRYVEELGAQRLVHGAVGEGMVALSLPAEMPFAEHFNLTVDPAAVHLFSRADGRRLN